MRKANLRRFLSLESYIIVSLLINSSNGWNALSRTRRFRWDLRDAQTGITSSILGELQPIQTDESESFVGAMGVPTFYATGNHQSPEEVIPSVSASKAARGLEGAIGQGPAFVLDDVLRPTECDELIRTCESLGFRDFKAGKNHHGALQIIVPDSLTQRLTRQLAPHIGLEDIEERRIETEGSDDNVETRISVVGVNRRWRVYRYAPGGEENFAPHIDAGFPPSGVENGRMEWDVSNGAVVSRMTLLIYLNDDFVGGETKFYAPMETHEGLLCAVRPRKGSCLVFPQAVGEDALDHARKIWPPHEGSPVMKGSPKYVIRSDVMFQLEQSKHETDVLGRYDHLVRQTLLPKTSILDKRFLEHAASLYNPQMGVENMGLFLYSFLRLCKYQRVVEIGAGYTTLYILAALRDNQEEMKRIEKLENEGKCRMLDWPWTVKTEGRGKLPPMLLCVDNCEHQKETASGAVAVARTLGLDGPFEFKQADAFDMSLPSVEVLWCDFGVGSRMAEFCANAWQSLVPGGYLLCHSTLTNRRTREWLEATRAHKGASVTGLPAHEYREVSLLEPHKHYQNSISIFQKISGYTEPIFSEYA